MEWEWTKTGGRGKIYSFVVFHRVYHTGFKDEVPYVVAMVELEEGPHLMSNIIDCDPHTVCCEMPVEVVFEDVSETVTLPKFRPRKDGHP